MNYKELIAIDDSKWFSVLSPVKRAKTIKDNPVIIGFDTEFIKREDKQVTLSIQFAKDKQAGLHTISVPSSEDNLILRKALFKRAGLPIFPTNISKEALLGYLISFLFYTNDFKPVVLPSEIYLVSHFAQAELSNFENLDDIDLFQASRGLFGKLVVTNPKTSKPLRINFVDLFGIFASKQY